ncbi:MAG: anaerobic magnesium-protoporphyrin IX monomethyl ester cyclase [Myxococcota bacterium]|jgi:anaerobic magnesium-protoporphyrin IX monomethyl ester cyclase
MRVLLVNPSLNRQRLGKYWRFTTAVPPTGLAYLAAVLERDGFEVRIYDQHGVQASNDDLMHIMEQWKPAVVGFSCLTFVMETVEDASNRIRQKFPNVKILAGNIHATYFPKELVETGIADYVIREEGEEAILQVCRGIRNDQDPTWVNGTTCFENGGVKHNPTPALIDLDSLPYPAWNLLEGISYDPDPLKIAPLRSKNQPLAIQGSRGCPFACTFCSQDTMYKRVRVRSPESVVNELEYVHRTYGTTVFGFIDAIFPLSPKQGHAFADEMIRRGLHKKITWFTETRVDLVNYDLLKHLKESGLKFIQYGIESGDDEVLQKLMRKKTGVNQAREALKWSRQLDILTFGLFVVGMPGETRAQVLKTIAFAKELDPDIAKFNVAIPFPGSELWERYKHRVEGQPYWKYSGWFNANINDADNILAGDTLPTRELMYLQRRAMFEFYTQPRVMRRYFLEGMVPVDILAEGFYVMMSEFIRSVFPYARSQIKAMAA